MKLVRLKLVAVLAVVFALSACKKETPVTPVNNNKGKIAVDAKSLVNDVNTLYASAVRMVAMVGDGSLTGKKESALMSCAVVTVDTISMPHTVDFDLGAGCTNDDGTFFSGHLRIEFTDYDLKNNGCRINAIATNFVQGATEYNGNLEIHNQGPNGSGNPEITLTGTLNCYDHSLNQSINFTSNLTHEWISGSATTSDNDDDALSVTGGITGDDGAGTNFNVNITTPMIIDYAPTCLPYYNKGVFTWNVGINPTETYDYGDGTCDQLGYHIVNGDTTEFTIN